jgi:hypothetical protein
MWVSEYVCVLLGSGGVFFGVRPVAVINKIKYITCWRIPLRDPQ